ncbi:helix-turn-helix domain-containing protein [Caulobacter segnis]
MSCPRSPKTRRPPTAYRPSAVPCACALFRLLVRAGDEGANVTDLDRGWTQIPASTLSHHLAALSRAGLVRQANAAAS